MNRRVLAAASVGIALTLAAGFWGKDLCSDHGWDGYQYRTLCYNDILVLHGARGLADEPVPYVNGSGQLDDEVALDGSSREAGDLEYPAGTGLLVAAAALVTSDAVSFFRLTAVYLAALGAVAFAALSSIAADPRRLLLFAFGPALGLYAFHNWDLLAVAALALGLFAFARRRDALAGAAIGFGAAAKLFPGLALPAMVLARRRADGRLPWTMVVTAAISFLVVNLPFAAINFQGWLMPWRFQSTRFPNFETHWYMIFRHFGDANGDGFWWQVYPRLTGVLSAALLLVGGALLVRAEYRRPVVRPYALTFSLTVLLLLTGKVYSPQFALWLLPFFVLVRVPFRAFVAYVITDVAVWITVAAFLLSPSNPTTLPVLEVAVWIRYAVLARLLVWISRSEEAVLEAGSVPRATREVAV